MALCHFLNKISWRKPFSALAVSRSYSREMSEAEPKVVEFDSLKSKVISQDIILVDVREPEELKEDGKIPNSVNIPLGQIASAFKMTNSKFQAVYGVPKPDMKSDHLVLTCRSGKRATNAFHTLYDFGYRNIFVYKGSLLDWIKNDGPLEK